MDITEVARKGGKSRSEKKRAASRRNLALARASIKVALDVYRQTKNPEVQIELARAIKSAATTLEKSAIKTTQERPSMFAPVLVTRKAE